MRQKLGDNIVIRSIVAIRPSVAMIRWGLLWLVAVALTGCGAAVNTEPTVLQSSPAMEYQIGPADVLSINVWNNEFLQEQVTVRPDGMISYPLVGELYVIGLTPAELQAVMEQELETYINVLEGEVSVMVDEVHSYTVSVLGEVENEGRYEFNSQATVFDAIAEAGGLTDFASESNIRIMRPVEGGMQQIPFNYRRILRNGTNGEDIFVYPGDTVIVP